MNVHTTKITRLVFNSDTTIGLDEPTKERVWVFTLRTKLDSTDLLKINVLLLQSCYRDQNKFQLERCLHRVPNNVKRSYESVFNVGKENCIHDCLTVLVSEYIKIISIHQTRTHLNTFVCAYTWHYHPRDWVVVYTHNYNSREMHHVTLLCGVTVASW